MEYVFSLNEEFRLEYIRLDNLLKDVFSSDRGISSYVEEMEYFFQSSLSTNFQFEQFYKNLKHVRWVRNQISHEEVPPDFVKESDLLFVKNFYQLILSQEDPLSLVEKYRRKLQREKPELRYDVSLKSRKRRTSRQENDEVSTEAVVTVIVLTIITILGILLFLA